MGCLVAGSLNDLFDREHWVALILLIDLIIRMRHEFDNVVRAHLEGEEGRVVDLVLIAVDVARPNGLDSYAKELACFLVNVEDDFGKRRLGHAGV